MATTEIPWQDYDYTFRRSVTLTVLDVTPIDHPVSVVVPILNKIRSDQLDVMVYYSATGASPSSSIIIPSTVRVDEDNNVVVIFPLQDQLSPSYSSEYEYYIYYNNPTFVPGATPDSYSPPQWPVDLSYDAAEVSYVKPGALWVNGVSSTVGASAYLSFYGQAVEPIFYTGPNGGIAYVQLDGGEIFPVDTYSSVTGLTNNTVLTISSLVDSFLESDLNLSIWNNSTDIVNAYFDNGLILDNSLNVAPAVATDNIYDLTNGQVGLQITPSYGNLGQSTSFVIDAGFGNQLRWDWNNGAFWCSYVTGGTTYATNLVYSDTAFAWVRIRESEGRVYWESSVDGVNWVTQTNVIDPFSITACAVILTAGNTGNTYLPGSTLATFKNLNTITSVNAGLTANVSSSNIAFYNLSNTLHSLQIQVSGKANASAVNPAISIAYFDIVKYINVQDLGEEISPDIVWTTVRVGS